MHYRRLRKDWKYEVRKNYSCSLLPCLAQASGKIVGAAKNGAAAKTYVEANGGCINVYQDYRWNGADLFPDLECTQEATLVHDALYQLIDEGQIDPKYRKCSDQQMYCMVRTYSSNWLASICLSWLASTMYTAVRWYQSVWWPFQMPAGLLGGLWGASVGFVLGKRIQCH